MTFFLVALSLSSCARSVEQSPIQELDGSVPAPSLRPAYTSSAKPLALGASRPPIGSPIVVRGTDGFQRASSSQPRATVERTGNEYVLNFEGADINDVLKAVLGDMLGLSYSTDPSIQGTISLHTATPLTRDAVLPAFEQALKIAGVALVSRAGGYDVVPLKGAAQRGTLQLYGARGAGSGYRVELVPLKYVAAEEIQRLLEPILPAGTVVQIDPQRNLIALAGTDSDLARAEETIATFDVDWLRSQSFGLFPLRYSQAKSVATDLEAITGGKGPLAGLVRVVPIDHLNAILVVSSRQSYVSAMREWIERFDRGSTSSEPRLFVYRVQNGRAADLANVLTRSLGRGGGTNASAQDATAGSAAVDGSIGTPTSATGLGPTSSPATANPLLGGLSGEGGGGGQQASPLGDVRITADENNNALLVVATPEKYALIEAAIEQLDIVPLQVLLEASIAEVDLTNELKYGLQYYFRSGQYSALQSSVQPGSIGLATGGLSLAFLSGTNIQAVLDLLSSVSTVKVISAPKVLVLNNHTANLQVGDQVPIATSSAVGVQTANAPIVNTIQLLDTGIILRVTPHVNSGGLVLLDVAQEVSASVPTTTSMINSPTIQQRKISSSIAVEDGQTIALGGLIRDNRTRSRSGIPFLMDLPYVGPLFSLTDNKVDRTELIVLMTPRVVRDRNGLQALTSELRNKLPLIRSFNAPAR